MIALSFKDLAERLGGRLLNRKFEDVEFAGISIDSRTVKAGQLFIAITGEKNDGHKFLDKAIENKCAGLLIRSDYAPGWEYQGKLPIVISDETHEAMLNLAKNRREKFDGKIIGITGSNGKTTTKEMTAAILSYKSDKVYKSPGNYNNLYGLPLAVFEMPGDTDYAVLEMGISEKGEMTRLAEIASPDLILITNIGPTHLETLGSIEGVAEAKMELVDAAAKDVPVIINADDEVLLKAAKKRDRKFITFGINSSADISGSLSEIGGMGLPELFIDGRKVTVKLFGLHQAYNLLAAYAVARTLDVDISPDDLNVIEYASDQFRGEIEQLEGITIISDCYNANPKSMHSGLNSFNRYLELNDNDEFRGVAIVGDMLELGEKSDEYHYQIGEQLAELDFDLTILVGAQSEQTMKGALENGLDKEKILHYADVATAGNELVEQIKHGDIVYLKASRGIGLEKIVTLIRGTALRQN